MGGKASKLKGAQGEREVADLIFYATGIHMQRNLEQVRKGGHDLDGISGLSIEVKRQETLCIPAWWRQTLAQAGGDLTPVLAYRQNNRPWNFIVGRDKQRLTHTQFIAWIRHYVSA